jgi:NAD(P)-dependent dehydrogenase (short-subunit alcohol dehydrogenase family)
VTTLNIEIVAIINTGFKDKVVLATGANHGIGVAIEVDFAQECAKVRIN